MKKLYFILETKGSTSELNLRRREALKIRCGKAHFQAIGSGAELHTATRWKDFKIHNANQGLKSQNQRRFLSYIPKI